MAEAGVASLSLSEVARRLGIRPPSLYKYFPSRLALFDRLFQLGHQQHLDEFRAGAATAEPGLPALISALEASGRWAMANQPLVQLLFWRPVPDYRLTCFFVDRNYRRRGVAAVALQGALGLIAQAGGGVAEGYPPDTQGKRTSASFLYNGTRSLFEKAGFRFERTKGTKNCVMRRTVAPS